MGQGRIGHTYTGDELGALASGAVASLAFIPAHVFIEDLWQAAYAAGLSARASARRSGAHVSGRVLRDCMRTACLRQLRRRRKIHEHELELLPG